MAHQQRSTEGLASYAGAGWSWDFLGDSKLSGDMKPDRPSTLPTMNGIKRATLSNQRNASESSTKRIKVHPSLPLPRFTKASSSLEHAAVPHANATNSKGSTPAVPRRSTTMPFVIDDDTEDDEIIELPPARTIPSTIAPVRTSRPTAPLDTKDEQLEISARLRRKALQKKLDRQLAGEGVEGGFRDQLSQRDEPQSASLGPPMLKSAFPFATKVATRQADRKLTVKSSLQPTVGATHAGVSAVTAGASRPVPQALPQPSARAHQSTREATEEKTMRKSRVREEYPQEQREIQQDGERKAREELEQRRHEAEAVRKQTEEKGIKEQERRKQAALRQYQEEEAKKREEVRVIREEADRLRKQQAFAANIAAERLLKEKELQEKLRLVQAKRLEDEEKAAAAAAAAQKRNEARQAFQQRQQRVATPIIDPKKAALFEKERVESTNRQQDIQTAQGARDALPTPAIPRVQTQRTRRPSEGIDSDPELPVVDEAPQLPIAFQRVSLTAKMREEQRQQHDELRKSTVAQQLERPETATPPGPMSLNSAAGTAAVAGREREAQPKPAQTASGSKKGNIPAMGEIAFSDIRLFQWREMGDTIDPAITRKFADQFPLKPRGRETLRCRYHLVKQAFNAGNVGPILLKRAFGGDEDARREINVLVHGAWPPPPPPPSPPKKTVGWAQRDAGNAESSPVGGAFTGAKLLLLPSEITPSDRKLVQWRDNGEQWALIGEKYRLETGKHAGESTLRRRYKDVKATLAHAGHREHVLIEGVLGDDALPEDGNRTKTPPKQLPPVVSKDSTRSLPDVRRDSVAGRLGCSPPPPIRNLHHEAGPLGAPVVPCTPVIGPVEPPAVPCPPVVGPVEHPAVPFPKSLEAESRMSTGGKSLDTNYLLDLLSHQAEVFMEQQQEKDEVSEVNSQNEEDYCYYIYQVFRREYTQEDAEDGIDMEDKDWVYCGKQYQDIEKANRAARKEILRPCAIANPYGDYFLSQHSLDGGLKHFELINQDGLGRIDVTVQRTLRMPADRIRPKSKAHWLAPWGYYVQERITTTIEEHNGFDITKEVIHSHAEILEATWTTSLPQANILAIRHYVDRTTPLEQNLTRRTVKIQEKVQSLNAALVDGEKFARDSGVDDEGRRCEVWVQGARLQGPRN